MQKLLITSAIALAAMVWNQDVSAAPESKENTPNMHMTATDSAAENMNEETSKEALAESKKNKKEKKSMEKEKKEMEKDVKEIEKELKDLEPELKELEKEIEKFEAESQAAGEKGSQMPEAAHEKNSGSKTH
ncbi:MAG: hypothetical protein H0X26_07170 [Alphaproteobacteria bacterium]|nr:hypothetical protein [Alphaproteobacteria bacterium]